MKSAQAVQTATDSQGDDVEVPLSEFAIAALTMHLFSLFEKMSNLSKWLVFM